MERSDRAGEGIWEARFRKFGYANFCLNFMHENVIFLDIIIMLLLGGRLCEVLCRPTTHLLPPLLKSILLHSAVGGGGGFPTVGTFFLCIKLAFSWMIVNVVA